MKIILILNFIWLSIIAAQEQRSWIDDDGVEVEIIKKIPGIINITYCLFGL